MKSRMVEVYEGEKVGPIDWSYNFLQHFEHLCSSDEYKLKRCDRAVAVLEKIEAEPTKWRVTIGQFSYDAYDVGMYDGWPFWKPTPAVRVFNVLGYEWRFFYELDGAEARE